MGKDLKGKELGKGFSQRKNGSYCARYIDRFGNRKSVYHKDLRVLKKEYLKHVYENSEGVSIVDENITLSKWFDVWLSTYKNNVVRENTKLYYTQVFRKHIEPVIGKFKICEISKLQCTQLLNNVKTKGLGWETQNKVRVVMLDMFERALEDQFVKRNPMKGVRLPSNKPKEERRVLSVEEQALFFECCAGTFYNNLFIVAVNTGLRPGELFALTWDDIDLEKKRIKVNKTLVYQKYLDDEMKKFHIEPPKTSGSNRTVPINRQCETALKRQYMQKKVVQARSVKESEFPDRLFVTKFNTPLNTQIYLEAIDRVVTELNLMLDNLEQFEPFSGHCFRHTFATRCIESGVAPKVLQQQLGHSTLQMTMDLYVHATDKYKNEEMKKFEDSIENIKITIDDVDRSFKTAVNDQKKIINITEKMA